MRSTPALNVCARLASAASAPNQPRVSLDGSPVSVPARGAALADCAGGDAANICAGSAIKRVSASR